MQPIMTNLIEAPREYDIRWGGRRCTVNPLGAKQARYVARRLLNTVGEALREAGASGGAANLDVVALGALFARLDDATLDWLTDTFSKVTRIEKEAGADEWTHPNAIADLVFGGGEGLNRWFGWLAFCVDMSCRDFFEGLLAEIKARQGLTKSASPSPSTSSRSGSSTASS